MPNLRLIASAAALVFAFPSSTLNAAVNNGAGAGAPFTIDVWQNDDGLPQNSVIAMTQTQDGYLWLGTLNGLVRFDGIRFTVYDESNTPGLSSSRIVSLFEDRQLNLWIGTETDGVVLVKNGQVTGVDIGRGTREGRLMSACQDASGVIWLYTADGQLCRYRDGKADVWLVGSDRSSNCRVLVAEDSGPLWIGSDRRLFAIDPAVALAQSELRPQHELPVRKLDFLLASARGGYWRLADDRVQKWRTNHLELTWEGFPWGRMPVTAACEDREGNLIVGTQGAGVFWFDAQGKATHLSTSQGLSHNYVLSVLVDREGTLWVGTDGGGLNRVKRQVFEVLDASRGLTVQSVAEDGQGGLWIGFNVVGLNVNGAGLWKDGLMQWFGPGQGLMNSSVWSVFTDRSQREWAGTWGGLFEFQNGRFQRATGAEGIHPPVLAMHQDRAGALWLGMRGGLARWDESNWKVFTTRDGLSADEVRALAEDTEGNLWIGTRGGGLNRLREGQFTALHKKDGLPSEDISSLYADRDGALWVGTFGSGLARFQGGQWARFSTKDGLISNSIGYLIEDDQGYLWIGSNAGLMRVRKKALNDFALGLATYIPCRAYGKLDGLPTRECTSGSQPGAGRTRDGRLWFPTIKGLASVNPAQLNLNPNTNPPPVLIETVLIEGQPQSESGLRTPSPQTVTVPAGRERVEIHYTSLNLAAPDRAIFKYRLEGHEKDWTEAGNSRVARYSKLPPRRYRFQVTACNEDGVWNEAGSVCALIVLPPFWQTWWFLGGSAAGLLGTIIAAVNAWSTQRFRRQLERLRQQEAVEKERSRIARDIHDQLGASLTQVALLGELVESDKELPDEVEAHARQISQTARDTTRALDEIVWAANPSNDTLEALINYVCKYAQEYLAVAGLRYRLEAPPQLPDATIPPEVRHNVFLASKEAVTNVVRHARATAVRIRFRLDSRSFVLEIEDDGRGIAAVGEQAIQSRNGVRNMRKRMEDIGGIFGIEPGPEGGTVVRLAAPLGHAGTTR